MFIILMLQKKLYKYSSPIFEIFKIFKKILIDPDKKDKKL